VAVHKGSLLFADSPSTIESLFAGKDSLEKATEYQRVVLALNRLLGKTACLRLFYREEPLVRQTWDELRAGKPKDKSSFLSQFIREVFLPGEGTEATSLDFALLPAFAAISKYTLGEGGVGAATTADGWSVVLFLRRAEGIPAGR
jgi:hypothetical protein